MITRHNEAIYEARKERITLAILASMKEVRSNRIETILQQPSHTSFGGRIAVMAQPHTTFFAI